MVETYLVLMEQKFYPKVLFSISSITVAFDTLTECLHVQWHEILPCGGVQCTALQLPHQMNPVFYGIGLPYPGVECYQA
jgi:hypothetical protein